MQTLLASWQFWAIGTAFFAALTAIFAKLGVAGVPPDFATFVRTIVILAVSAAIVTVTRQWQPLATVAARTWLVLALSGLATGASWLCYFRALDLGDAARVAPLDKLSVVLVAILATLLLGEKLSPANWLGVTLIAAGAMLVAWRG
jgi:transporter family protein